MGTVGEVHVVPSGKVYRQIFDAEVQLVRSLGEARCRSVRYGRSLDCRKIPLVRGLETQGRGPLSPRQLLWVDSMPNDGFTENPVIYRELDTLKAQKTQESEAEIAAWEVRGLADVIVPESSDRGIIQQVADRRQERHEAAITDLQRELVRISKEMEPSVLKAGKELQKKLASSDRTSQLLLQRLEGNADLTTLTMKDFKELWSSIALESFCRRQMIEDTSAALTKVEENRAKQIGAVLKRYTAKLEKICYIMPAEVYRFIHKEAMMINQAILANRRAIMKLTINLMEADLKQEGALRLRWQDRMKEWKLTWKDTVLNNFRAFMASKKIQNPLSIEKDLELMVREQTELNEERMQLLKSVSNLLPPTSTKSQVADWYTSLMTINKKIDCLNVQFVNRIRMQHEKVLQMCMAELQKSKGLLIDMKVCTKEEVEKFVSSEFFPLVGELQKRFEQELELMDKALERVAKLTDLQSKDLFKFAQGAAHLWDVLEISLSKQEKSLQKKLDDCRQQHDGENQTQEAHLDMVLDQLRQDSSQEGLQACMKKALRSLEDIRAGYEKFHSDQEAIVGSYPGSILSELKSYSASVSQYFGVKEIFKETLALEMEEKKLVKTCVTAEGQTELKTEETAPVLQDLGRQDLLEPIDGGEITPDTQGQDPELHSEPGDLTATPEPSTLQEQTMEPDISGGQLLQQTAQPEDIVAALSEPAELSESEDQPSIESGQDNSREGSGSQLLQQTAQPEDIVAELSEPAELSESEDQPSIESGQDNSREGSVLEVTEETSAEESTEREVTSQASVGSQEEICITPELPPNSFITSNGNIYSLLLPEEMAQRKGKTGWFISAEQTESKKAFITEVETEDNPPVYLEHILIPENILKALKERIRLGFFEHLENWFDQALANAESVVSAKMEELKSELELRLHLHQPRSQRIEKDIHNVRAAELLLHSDRVERHCAGVVDALVKMKNLSIQLRDEMKKKTKEFSKRVADMEPLFLNANKSEKLMILSNSLYRDRDKHVEGIKVSMRNYRQTLEGTLGMLRDSNSEFIKSFRLFAEGGNFSPDEVERFRKDLEQAASRIDCSEGFIMVDLEGVESKCIEQAKGVVRKFEVRFQSLTTDMVFLEKIQRLLTNLQVKIKGEVAKSNLQTENLQASLDALSKKIDACAHPNLDKEAVTPNDLHLFMKSVVEEVTQRCNYLNCLLDATPVPTEPPLQGPIAATVRQDSKVTFAGTDIVLQPCKLGRPIYDDAAVSLIKNLTHTKRSTKQASRHSEHQSPGQGTRQNPPTMMPRPPTPSADTRENASPTASPVMAFAEEKRKSAVRRSSVSGRRHVKLTRFDQSLQVFGEKPELEQPDDFKGKLNALLWECNNTMLALAEEFYKKKEKRLIGRSDFLKDTFEECAGVLVQKLLSYQSQGDEYHNACLNEFREQLEECERLLAQVPPLLMNDLQKQHLGELRGAIGEIQTGFKSHIRELDAAKEVNRKLLRPSLGHPDSHQELLALCQQEEERQRILLDAISINTQSLKDCVAQCAESFVAALAFFAESLLLEFDESLNVDDIQTAKTEVPKEKLFTLIRRRQAGLPVEVSQYSPVVERTGRKWSGIARIVIAGTMDGDGSKKHSTESMAENGSSNHDTGSITTAKTSLAHLSVVEARDAAYMEFQRNVELEMAKIVASDTSQVSEAQRWEKWWQQAVLEIQQLYT
ncbi:coiled-coil domain-containing protein 180 isoform X2 [Lissotriton helveticus]